MKAGNRAAFLFLSLSVFVSLLAVSVGSANVWAAGVTVNGTASEKLTLTAGKSIIIDSQFPVKRFSISAPQIADAIVLTPKQIYLTGKAPGLTNLMFWGEGDKLAAVFDVEVSPDIAALKAKLHEAFPQETNIKVSSARDSITLSGTVSDAATLSQVLSIADAYTPGTKEGKKLLNLLDVGGVQQVMLEVRVSEMSKTLGRRLGVDFSAVGRSGREGNFSVLSNLFDPTVNPISGFLDALYIRGDVTWTLLIDALKERGLVKVLAEPTLITMSGKSANFLAGGEFPIPVPQAGGNSNIITITYKTFGVGLTFTPTVLSNGKINLNVAPEVSELDFANAVNLLGFVVPALTTRRAMTTIELADGQSFAIAGLLRDDVRQTMRKFPLLGDIPVLGALFRSSQFQKSETELVIIVTPHLVRPLDMAKQTLPTDDFVEPNDLDFYLLGKMEGMGPARNKAAGAQRSLAGKGGGLDGEFGHIVP
jgi:pilus assembly protein CpaC